MQPSLAPSLLLLLLLPALATPALAEARAGGHVTAAIPEHDASDPEAPTVTRENVLESERFWPFQTALKEPWTPPGAVSALGPELPGVLIRVEGDGRARVDFGRDGLHDVPLERTDLLERANRVRRGEEAKRGPNLLQAIGPRLLDAAADPPQPLAYAEAARQERFLLVFAAPEAGTLGPIAEALAPLRQREGLLTVFFPQGHVPDRAVRARLRELDWPVAFLYDHLAEAYTRTLLEAETALPAVLLATAEGRLLFQDAWDARAAAGLVAALERAEALAGLAAARTERPRASVSAPPPEPAPSPAR